jgi:hypothetical protein
VLWLLVGSREEDGFGMGNSPFDPSTDSKAAECIAKYGGNKMCAGLAHACIGSDLEIQWHQEHELMRDVSSDRQRAVCSVL